MRVGFERSGAAGEAAHFAGEPEALTGRDQPYNKLLHAVVLGAYTLSYTLVSFTLGLMQASPKYYVEFPVWAVCLLMLLGGTDNLMACNLNDVEDWKRFHVKQLFEGGLVVYIVAVYGTFSSEAVKEYKKPLWGILLVNVLQSCVRIKSMRMASKSNLLSRNVKPIVDHMKDEHHNKAPPASGEGPNTETMKGYRYVVGGEHRPKDYVKWLKHATGYNRIEAELNIVTVEQIWDCEERLLNLRLKDVCLSMALSKMLNRRFAGCKLHEAELQKTHDFVFKGLLTVGHNPYERAFRVIEVELGFVYDLYYTRYPYLYRKVRYLALCLPVAMVIFCSWLTYQIYKKHKEPDSSGDTAVMTTFLLMAVVTFLEVFQLYLHLASDWFKVALIRSCVARHSLKSRSCFSDTIISLLLRLKRLRPWEDKLGQYSLLQSYNARRRISYCIHYVTLCLADKAKKGRRRGKLVKLSKQVKKAVLESLKESDGSLTNGVRSLRTNKVVELLSWACEASDGMVTHNILVWHVATTICKHQLDAALDKIAPLSDDESNAIDTASSLSQYCAYLVAFAPDLLPDHSFDSASELDKAIEEARDIGPLQGAKTMEDKCKILMSKRETENPPLVVEGARLAWQLTNDIKDRALRWKVLSDFWAEMTLYIAPCDDAQARAHLEALARGGEFITHLWALLTHAGVLKRASAGSQVV